jgi:signal transduction histidine kinase
MDRPEVPWLCPLITFLTKMSFNQKLAAAFGTALAIFIFLSVLSYRRTLQDDQDEAWVAHTHRVLETLDWLSAALQEAEASQRGYIITGEDRYSGEYDSAKQTSVGSVKALRDLTSDNPKQQYSLDQLEPLVTKKFTALDERNDIKQRSGTVTSALIDEGSSYTGAILDLIVKMKAEEEQLLTQRTKAAKNTSANLKEAIGVGNVLAFVFLVSAALTLRREMNRRNRAEGALGQSEERLRIRSAHLEAANKELDAFCYSVAHDLRAPLRGIDGFSQALVEDYGDRLDSQGKECLQRVRLSAQRMATLIDDLLNLSRITRAEMRQDIVDLSSIADSIAIDLHAREPQRKVTFAIVPGLQAKADPRFLRIILENLLGNSWKFTSQREDARIEVGRTQQNGKSAYFVRDNGVGFDPAYASKLFGVFQRLHGMNEFPGTGIGLATVQRIIQRHGGRVWADAAPGCGATFYFSL